MILNSNIEMLESDYDGMEVEITLCFTFIHFFYKIKDVKNKRELMISYVPEKLSGYIPCFFLKSKIIERLKMDNYINLYRFRVKEYKKIDKSKRYNLLFFLPIFNISNCVGHCIKMFINNLE